MGISRRQIGCEQHTLKKKFVPLSRPLLQLLGIRNHFLSGHFCIIQNQRELHVLLDVMFYDILDEKRKALLPLFGSFKDDFYLAGGTSLALQLGHRDSIDFDFFTESVFDTTKLENRLRMIFDGHTLEKTQEEENTLSIIVDESIKVSFMTYAYPLIEAPINEEFLTLASMRDIACMKFSAITRRATIKDYIDLYFILKNLSLESLLVDARKKFPMLDTNLILKSLVYFDDVSDEPMKFKRGNDTNFDRVKLFLMELVKKTA